MKRIRLYLPNVLLTFLLVFFLLGSELTMLASRVALNADAFALVEQQQDLGGKAYSTLETYFNTRSNSTGIPAEVFLAAVDRDAVGRGIHASVEAAFAYLNGRADSFSYTMDFTALEDSVNAFFSDYAEAGGYEKDAVYEQKVASVIAEAEGEILFVTDTFKFSVLEENGWLGRLRKAVSYLDLLQTVCLAGTAVILVLLLLCNLRQFAHMAYWLGLAGLIGGLLLLVPAVYIQATDFFSGFAIKDPQIFAAVVGFLQLLTQRALMMAIATAAAGLVLLVLFAVLHSHKEKAQES